MASLQSSTVNGDLTVTGSITEGGYTSYPERVYTINLSAQSTSNFYPIVLDASPGEGANGVWHHRFSVEMPSQSGAVNFNNHTLVAEVRGQGWSDQQLFYRAFHTFYDTAERSILGIWRGTQSWYGVVVYVRGGMTYYVRSNSRSVAAYTSAVTLNSSATFAIKNASNTDVSGTSANISEMLNLINANAGFYYSNIVYATNFSGSGSLLTSLTAGNLSGTIPSAVLGNSSLYVGTTQIALNRSSASQTLTGISIDGNAATTTNLSTNRTNWSTNGTITAVVGQLAWKNYGNNHTIFDASNSTSPAGGAVNNVNPDIAWSTTYPTLMGWNGVNTYGVRVDSSRYSGQADNSYNLLLTGLGTSTVNVGNTSTAVYRNENGLGAALAYAPVLHVSGGDTMWQIQGTYGGSGNGGLYFRQGLSGSWGNWITMLSSANYSSYALPLTGGTLTGNSGVLLAGANDARFDIRSNTAGAWLDIRSEANGYAAVNLYGGGATTGMWSAGMSGGSSAYRITTGAQGAGSEVMVMNRSTLATTFSTSVSSPIFYDSNNTNYYLNPAGASVLNGLKFSPSGSNVSGDDAIISIVKPDDADWAIQVSGGREYGIDLNMAATHTYAFRSLKAGTQYFRIGSDYLYHDTSIRAPIFYDTNDTNYYVDPANISVLAALRAPSIGSSYTNHFQIREANGGNGITTDSYAPSIGFHWAGVVASNITLESSGRISIRNNPGTAYENFIANIVYGSSSVQTPIVYDSNNTNYYCDPAASTSLNIAGQITTNRSSGTLLSIAGADTIGYNDTSGRGAYIKGTAGTYVYGGALYYDGSAIRQILYEDTWLNNKYFDDNGAIYGLIFYDANNSNYYLDPASTSNLVGLTVANTISGSISGNAATATTSTRLSDATGSLRIANPGGAAYGTSSSSVTGAIKIKLPTAAYQSTTMMRFTVRIYEYAGSSSGTSRTLEIGGYNYSDGQWYNFFATQNTMGGGEINVRFGNDGASNCVWIGNTDTVWAYPQVSVTDFQAGFNNATTAIWSTGWTISFITTFDTVTNGPIIAAKPLNSQNYSAYSSFSGVIKGDAGANYPHSFTNTDSGNTHWTNRNDRLLTSNGTNWATDGRDPIMALVTSGNSNATTIANSIGLTLHNESQTNNTFSPAITFSNRSNSGNYNSVYAAIIGKKTGQGVDSNWSAGELHFYTMPVGAYENDVPSLLINSAGNVGIGTTNPATLFQIGTGTPTSATGGLQFGDDTGTRIYRSGSNTLTMGGTFVATTFSGALSGNATSSTATNDILPTSWSIGIIEEASVKPFLFNTLGDALAFQTISNLQYWNGSAWQSYTNSGIQQILTGNIQNTTATVTPTNRKFRFEFTTAAYIGGGILVVHQTWNNGAHQISSMLEYWNGSSWITVITERSSTGGGGENDYHFYNRGNIHGNWTLYRVTITSADTTNNTSYTGIQLLYDYTRANLPNNFLPFSWDYLRNVTLGARLNAFDMVSKQYIYVRHIEGKNWDTYDTTASGLYLNYASNQPVYIGSATNLALHAGNYSGYSNFSGSVISGYGSFASPGHIIGDAQYGLYVASGNLYYKSASSGIHYWRNTADSANVMQLSNAGNLLLFGDGTNKFGIGFASAGENTYSIQHSGTSNKLLLGNDVSGTEYTTMTLTAAASSAGGNVGIGTTSPSGKLTITTNSDQLRLETASGPTNYYAVINSRYDSTHPFGIYVANNSVSTAEYFGVYADGGGANPRVSFPTGNIGIGNTNPATLLQIGTGTPTSATSGIQFGDDTGTRIYRGTTNQIRISGNFTSDGYLQTLNNEIYPNGWAATLNIYCGNSAQNAWISGIALSPGGNVRIPGGLVNSGLSAQWSVSGGGTVTFNGSSVLWSQRVIAIPVEKTEFSAQGYIDINCPTSGTVVYYNSSDVTTTVTCTANGIPLGQWEALYYEITPGQTNTSDQTKFRVVAYPNSVWRPSSNWLLLAIRNTDAEVVRWIPGQANIKSGGSYDFSRVTEYFYANDYYLNGGTSTYVRSNNSFNFLTNAGGAQAGKFANIQVSSSYSGTLPTDGILFGTDTNLYRNSADVLKTDDSLIINSKCAVATSISATYTVDINGSLHYTSASASSDARFKKNIEPINDALIKLNNVRGVKFEWNEFVNARRNGYVLNKPTLGVIAQELEAVFPELVDHWHLSDDCPDARAVNYEKIIPVLIEAVKELNNKNIQLEARLSALESKLQ